MSHDAIVIGAGSSGLVAAHLLRRAGKRVAVLERDAAPAATPEPGWVPPAVVDALDLAAPGFEVHRDDPWLTTGTLSLYQDVARSAEAIRALSPADAARWPAFCERMRQLGSALEELYAQPAPDVETREAGELLRLGLLGLKVRRRGRQATIDLLRTLPMSAADLLNEWFETDALKAALATGAVRHLMQGPRSGGTAFVMIHHHAGSAAGVFRAPRTNLRQVLAERAGADVTFGVRVSRVLAGHGAVTGVVLESGDTLEAPVVLSTVGPRATLQGLLEPGWLEPEFVRAVGNIRSAGVVATVTLTVDRDPGFTNLTIAPSLEYVERAYDDAKYGRVSAAPVIEARAEDQRVVAAVQYVPYAALLGPNDRQALGALVVTLLADRVPALAGAVTGMEVATPRDIEADRGTTGGHAYHGDLGLDQILFMRPVAGWSRSTTPVRGLFLAGPGTHPGGGIAGMSGLFAAREILRQARA